jgi:Ser/Thr protein kinase RdoA (MazF antagonist)
MHSLSHVEANFRVSEPAGLPGRLKIVRCARPAKQVRPQQQAQLHLRPRHVSVVRALATGASFAHRFFGVGRRGARAARRHRALSA